MKSESIIDFSLNVNSIILRAYRLEMNFFFLLINLEMKYQQRKKKRGNMFYSKKILKLHRN